MAKSISQVQEAFEFFFESLCDERFSKSLKLQNLGERNLLPLVRSFLLGYFGEIIFPEVQVDLPTMPSGKGRVDFMVDDVVVELAVRTQSCQAGKLSAEANRTEVQKLVKFKGKSLLVLFDFSREAMCTRSLNEFRKIPSLGSGNFSKSPFSISYLVQDVDGRIIHIRKRISP